MAVAHTGSCPSREAGPRYLATARLTPWTKIILVKFTVRLGVYLAGGSPRSHGV